MKADFHSHILSCYIFSYIICLSSQDGKLWVPQLDSVYGEQYKRGLICPQSLPLRRLGDAAPAETIFFAGIEIWRQSSENIAKKNRKAGDQSPCAKLGGISTKTILLNLKLYIK